MDWDKWLGGLALAAITGLTVLAYRHPKPYAKLGTVLEWIVAFTYLCTQV